MSKTDRLRVVDLAALFAGQLAARTLSDAGASVHRVDLLGGNPLHAFADDPRRAHLESLASGGKTLVRVDLADSDSVGQLVALLQRADVVVLSHDTVPELRTMAKTFARPDAVFCDVGIADGWELPFTVDPVAQDAFVQALAGTAQMNGHPEGAPLPSAVGLIHSLTACHAAIAVLAACMDNRRAERGAHVRVCMRDVAVSMALEHHALARDTGGRFPAGRQGNHSDGDTLGVYRGPASDYVIEVWGEGPDGMWARLADALERPDLVTDPNFSTDRARVVRMPEIVDLVEEWLRRYSDAEIEHRLRGAKVTFGRILRSDQALSLRQLEERGLRTDDAAGRAGGYLPMSGLRRASGLRRTSDKEVQLVRAPSKEQLPSRPTAGSSTDFRPLAGLKVVELGAAIAGPMATRILADLGATVLKIESPAGDMMRSYRPPTYDSVAIFAQFSAGKRSIALNLRNRDDLAMAKSLIGRADLLVQNVTPGSLDRLGLGYDQCRQLNPDLIYCSVSGFGQSGEWRSMRAVDPTIQAWSGFASLMGEPDGQPYLDRAGYLDSGTASQAALACIAEWLRGTADGEVSTALQDWSFPVLEK